MVTWIFWKGLRNIFTRLLVDMIIDDKHLKTRKIREAEEAARRSRITKVLATPLEFFFVYVLRVLGSQ